MIDRPAEWVAEACGGRLVAGDPASAGPRLAVVDSRAVGGGDLFVGIAGQRADGGAFAEAAFEHGAWGALVSEEHAARLAGRDRPVIAVEDPTAALGRLARAWRRELRCQVIGITGSTGKTSTKDLVRALVSDTLVTHATHENLNTEIGLPLTVLEAERGTQCLVLEMAMRGEGQIAELTSIAKPDVGVIVNVGPVHLELLGTIERVAAAKAELTAGLRAGATAVLPHGEALLEPHRRTDLTTVTFGPGGDVRLVSLEPGLARIDAAGEPIEIAVPFAEPHQALNLLAAVAAVRALGVEPPARPAVRFSSLRGEVIERAEGVTVVNDCYNANPMSMTAALEHLAATPAERHLAILGGMAELGPDAPRYHREVGELADRLGLDVLITVGELALPIADGFEGERYALGSPDEAAALLDEIARPGDRVLIKGSRSVGLERVMASPAARSEAGA